MPWSTAAQHRRYFSQFGRSYDDGPPPHRGSSTTVPPYGEGTREAIREYEELFMLGHAPVVVPLLERWQYLDRVATASEKQEFLEPLIAKTQAHPAIAQGELLMVLLALEPLRRSIAGRFLRSQRVHHGAPTTAKERADAQLLREVELRDVIATTRSDTLRVVHSYRVGRVAPGALFGWFREALSHRLLEELEAAFAAPTAAYSRDEAEAVQCFLHGLGDFDRPHLRHRAAFRRWRWESGADEVYANVDEYLEHPRVRDVCRSALDRLAPRQREVLERFYFERVSLEQIARDWHRSPSTARNTKGQAESRLRGDDVFFTSLAAVGMVRDAARLDAIRRRYPNGRPTATGARRVVIDAA
jgi:hypothetical protein